jgi:hypothetical protein
MAEQSRYFVRIKAGTRLARNDDGKYYPVESDDPSAEGELMEDVVAEVPGPDRPVDVDAKMLVSRMIQ